MFVAGIDVGSVAAKAVVLNVAQCQLVGFAILPTGWNARQAGEQVLEEACHKAGISSSTLHCIVGTGYGRISLPFVTRVVTEITCHARGAHQLFPDTGMVLDIGGQDSKVIALEKDGSVSDFIMNDKCAAGTGRFLQVLSGILDMDLDTLSRVAKAGQPANISSMCAVFAETEIIGLLAQGVLPENIAAGVFVSIARRMRGLAGRIPLRGQCTFTGGLATSSVFSHLLAIELGVPVNIPEQPQLVGALGAALLAAHDCK